MYAIGGSANPTINSQGNRYLAPTDPFAKEVHCSPSSVSCQDSPHSLTLYFDRTGDEEGGHGCERVEELELEVGG